MAPDGTLRSAAADNLPIRPHPTSNHSSSQNNGNGSAPFDIVRTYRDLLNSDRDLTMPVAAIESLIELLQATPSSTAMETVEIVKKEKARLLASVPNPLPLLAGADLFEQFLLRSLRGPPATGPGSGSSACDRVLSFEQTRQHLLENKQLFAQRAKSARDNIALWGSRYVSDGHIVLTMGGSRTVTKILLRAAADQSKHFKVIYVTDDASTSRTNARSDVAVAQLRDAGLEVETISPGKVHYMLANQKKINLVLVGAEAVMQNGGIISGMGTAQLAHLTATVKGGIKRFYVAAETHKICRKTPIAYPMVNRVGVNQKDVSKFDNIGVDVEGVLDQQDEVDYTDPEMISGGFITEQGVKMAYQIWEMVDDYM
ncbi:translation initiation factor eIF-2B subunit alpha [Collariella sp. IMI 366227]|nr:translation initiation factor eIF-2B subunit alpha [Collariella sp. IMI 366227]